MASYPTINDLFNAFTANFYKIPSYHGPILNIIPIVDEPRDGANQPADNSGHNISYEPIRNVDCTYSNLSPVSA